MLTLSFCISTTQELVGGGGGHQQSERLSVSRLRSPAPPMVNQVGKGWVCPDHDGVSVQILLLGGTCTRHSDTSSTAGLANVGKDKRVEIGHVA